MSDFYRGTLIFPADAMNIEGVRNAVQDCRDIEDYWREKQDGIMVMRIYSHIARNGEFEEIQDALEQHHIPYDLISGGDYGLDRLTCFGFIRGQWCKLEVDEYEYIHARRVLAIVNDPNTDDSGKIDRLKELALKHSGGNIPSLAERMAEK